MLGWRFYIASALALSRPAFAANVPALLSLSGELTNSSGSPIVQSGVNFRLTLYDANDTCALYTEQHLGVDLNQTNGRFAFTLGAGSSIANNVAGSLALDTSVFNNSGATTVSGCGSVNLNPGDPRHLKVEYDLGSGFTALTPNVSVVSSANALIAETLAGLGPGQFIQVASNGSTSLTQANTNYAFSSVNWPRLKALLDGNSNQYLASSGTSPVDMNGNRVIDVADPTALQDAATKHYVDTNVAGSPVDVSGVGPATGGGKTLVWDQVADKWVAQTLSTAPTGSAGGSLTGTYPNPTIATGALTAAMVGTANAGISRMIMTDPTTGTGLVIGSCSLGQVYAWTASGFACTSVSSLSPVTSVAGSTGAVTLNAGMINGLGTSALYDWGTGAGQIPRLDGSARLPAVDGSQILNVNASLLQSRTVASIAPLAGQVLGWNNVSSQWTPVSVASGSAPVNIVTSTGLLGGPITQGGTLSVDVGSAAGKIVQENANAQIAQLSGTSTLPSYSFVGNTSTGLFSPGTNQLALATNGTTGLTMNAAGYVGIGSTAPAYTLDLGSGASTLRVGSGGAGFNTTPQPSYDIGVGTNGITSAGIILDNRPGQPNFALNSAGSNYGLLSNVDAHTWSIGYGTSLNSTGSTSLSWTDGGRVGIGTLTPAAGFDVATTGTNSALIIPRDTTSNRPTGVNGMLRYNTTSNGLEGFVNGAWSTLSAGSTAGTVTNVTTDATLLGGPITTTGTLGVNVGSAAGKIVQENANAQIAQLTGSAALPSYSFVGNTNTGLFSPGANRLALATNGSTALTVAANGWVGIGTSTPAALLDVEGGTSAYLQPVSPITLQAQVGNGVTGAALNLNAGGTITAGVGGAVNISAGSGMSGGGALNLNAGNMFGGGGPGGAINLVAGNTNYTGSVAGAITIASGTGSFSAFGGNILILPGPGPAGNGLVGVGTTAPLAGFDVNFTGTTSALIVPRDTTANRPTGVNGMLRYNTTTAALEGYQAGGWTNLVGGGTASSLPFNGLTAATGTSTIDNGSFAQAWAWSSATTQTPLSISANALTSGTGLSLTTSSAALNSTTGLLQVANLGTATSGILARFQSSGTAGSGLTVLTNGNVGVGTAAPAFGLDVQANNSTYGVVSIANTASAAYIPTGGSFAPNIAAGQEVYWSVGKSNTTANAANWTFGYQGNASAANYMGFGFYGGPKLMTLNYAGNMGLGTTIPLAALDVSVTGTSSAILVPRDTTANRPSGVNGMLRYNTTTAAFEGYQAGAWANLIGSGSTSFPLLAPNGTTSAPSYAFSASPSTGIYSPGAGQIAMSANGTTALSVSAAGNIAIGTASTPSVVEIAQTTALNQTPALKITQTSTNSSASTMSAMAINSIASGNDDATRSMILDLQAGGTSTFQFTRAGSFNLTSSGNIGFGTAGFIQMNSNNLKLQTYFDTIFTAQNGVEEMRLKSNGYLGIGTASPGAILDAYGTGAGSAIIVPRDTTTNRPTGVNGMLRYNTTTAAFEGYQAGAWTNLITAGGGTASSLALNGLLAATGTNAIDNTNFAQTWNWSTATTQTPLSITANALAGGSALSLTSSSASLNSTNGLLQVANLGTSTSGVLARLQSNSATGSGVTVMNNGAVGIGATPASNTYLLTVNGANPGVHIQNGGASYLDIAGVSNAGYFSAAASPNDAVIRNTNGNLILSAQNTSNNILFTTGPTNGDATKMALLNNGNLGIGNSTPLVALDVTSVGTASGILIPRDTTANRPTGVNGMLRYNTTTAAFEGFAAGAWGALGGGGGGGGGSSQWTGTAGSAIYYSGGNVGIGTSAPTAPLHVAGSTMVLGAGEGTTTPASSTLRGAQGTGSNVTGQNLYLQPGNGTGVGGSGSLIVQTALPTAGIAFAGARTQGTYLNANTYTMSSYVVSPNANRVLIVVATNTQTAGAYASSVTFGGTALTQLDSRNNGNGYQVIYYLNNPTATTANLVVNYATSATWATVTAFVVYNVDTTNPFGGVVGNTGTAGTTDVLSPSSTSTSTILDIGSEDSSTTITPGAGQVSVAYNSAFDNQTVSQKPGGSGVTVSDTFGSSLWFHAAFAVNAYPGLANNTMVDRLAITPAGSVGISNDFPQAALDIAVTGTTSAIIVPRDTTANRPTGVNGMIRYNTSTNAVEAYTNSSWSSLLTGSYLPLAGGTMTGAINMGSQNITAIGANLTGNSALTVAAGGTAQSLTLRSTTTGSVLLASGNGTSLTVLDGGASTVNSVSAKGSATGAAPVVAAMGSDANINLSLAAKGTGNVLISTGSLGIGTTVPLAGLDVSLTGSTSSAIVLPRDTTANRPTGANGMIRYNTTANALEAYVNGSWVQISVQPVGSTANVTAMGPPVGASIYSYTASANYTPAFGSLTNINNGVWPANGTQTSNNASCLSFRDTSVSPAQTLVLDLGTTQTIGNVYAAIEGWSGDMVLGIAFSLDGTNYTSSASIYPNASANSTAYKTLALGPSVTARYVRLTNMASIGSSYYQYEAICQFAVGP